jgi:LPXTG-site transpeptidase (sortase) family protein
MGAQRPAHRRTRRDRAGSADLRRRRWRTGTLTVLVVVGLGTVGLGLQAPAEPPSPGAGQRGSLEGTGERGPAMPRSEPVRLDVPAVGIRTRLVTLGLEPDGTLEVPSEPMRAGWYTGSPTPGQRGPSVVAGHVDSETGPAVFYRLGDLATGARIEVTREDGSVARFRVTAVRAYAKADFPSRTVYGNTDRATLRLITCSDWNADTEEYDGNIVVFAELDEGVA